MSGEIALMDVPGGVAERELTANGVRFRYLERGTGPLVLFLHGFPDNARTWLRQLDHFAAAGYRAVAPYMRGYAPSSEAKDGRYDPEVLGTDVSAMIAELSPGVPVAVVAMDWGGVALQAALSTGTANISAAVLMNTAHPYTLSDSVRDPEFVHRSFHFWFFQLDTAEWATAMPGLPMVDYIWRIWSPNLKDDEHIQSVKATLSAPNGIKNALGYYRSLWHAVRANKVPAGLIRTPTLSIFGATDFTALHSHLEQRGFCGPYQRVLLPDVGHFPHREVPDQFAALALNWIGQHFANALNPTVSNRPDASN